MLANVFTLLTFLLSFGNPPETLPDNWRKNSSYHKEYYETGKPKAEGWLYNGVKTGYWRFYHANGKISEQGEYKNSKRIKYWYFYSSRGKKTSEGHFKKGKRANWWLFYDENGNLNHKCQLNNGIKNGYCLMYKNTKLTSAKKYKNGKEIKEWFSFSSFRRENNLSDLK